MAWEWSHTNEAYQYAKDQLCQLNRHKLEVIYSEWHAFLPDSNDDFNEEKYEKARVDAMSLPTDVLVEFIWDKMEEQKTCTNGGFEAWCCPYGCLPHLVAFSPKE